MCEGIPQTGCDVIPHSGRRVPGVAPYTGALLIHLVVDGRALMARISVAILALLELFTHWHAGRSQVALRESLEDRPRSHPQILAAGSSRAGRYWGSSHG